MFNYSTGPVELADDVRAALCTAPGTSHSSRGQLLIAETYQLLRQVLRVPDDFDLVLLPGSIRQALATVIRNAMPPGKPSVSVVAGYWGSFMAETCRAISPRAVAVTPVELMGNVRRIPRGPVGLVTIADMETETGLMPDGTTRAWVAQARAGGALVIADAACTAPIHPIDFDSADIVVLGSHKCLGAPAGLGIVLLRRDIELRADWAVDAFRRDAQHKRAYSAGRQVSPSHQPPLPTLPVEIVAALAASLRGIRDEPSPLDRARAAAEELRRGCVAVGLQIPFAGPLEGATVTRIDVPAAIGSERLRARLADRGYFVIGGIGNSAATDFIRVGTMSEPQCAPANIDGFLNALEESCRVGAGSL